MEEMSSPLSPAEADLVSYNCYMMALANKGQWQRVEECLVKMEVQGMNADEFTYVALVRAYLNASMLEDAVKVSTSTYEATFLTTKPLHLSCTFFSMVVRVNIVASRTHLWPRAGNVAILHLDCCTVGTWKDTCET